MSEEQNTTPVVTVEETNSENKNPNTSVSQDSKTFAIIAHLGGIFFGFVPALIIMLVKNDDKFVTEEA